MRPPRPPQPPGSRLSPTRAERVHWQAAADRLGMTLNEVVRGAVNAEAESILQQDSDDAQPILEAPCSLP